MNFFSNCRGRGNESWLYEKLLRLVQYSYGARALARFNLLYEKTQKMPSPLGFCKLKRPRTRGRAPLRHESRKPILQGSINDSSRRRLQVWLAAILVLAFSFLASATTNLVVSVEAVIQGGSSANNDIDEAAAGYLHVI